MNIELVGAGSVGGGPRVFSGLDYPTTVIVQKGNVLTVEEMEALVDRAISMMMSNEVENVFT